MPRPKGFRAANANGEVRGHVIDIDSSLCCPGSTFRVRATGRLSRLAAETSFTLA
jgi:hypothetical protein